MNLSRSNLLLGAVQGAGLLLLSGCEKAFNSLQQNKKFLSVLESAEGANQRLQRLLTGKNKLAQEFTEQEISRYFKPNGNPPPITMDYAADAKKQWRHGDWRSLVWSSSRRGFHWPTLSRCRHGRRSPDTIASKAGARLRNGKGFL